MPVILKLLLLSALRVVELYKNCLECESDVDNWYGFLPPNQGSLNEKL